MVDEEFETELNEYIKNYRDGLMDEPSYKDVAKWAWAKAQDEIRRLKLQDSGERTALILEHDKLKQKVSIVEAENNEWANKCFEFKQRCDKLAEAVEKASDHNFWTDNYVGWLLGDAVADHFDKALKEYRSEEPNLDSLGTQNIRGEE